MRRLFWMECTLVLLLSGLVGCDDPGSPKRSHFYECASNSKILFGENKYITQAGETTLTVIDFQDALPDTLPYNSWLTVHYFGWANSRDSLDYTDPLLEMRYQYRFTREGEHIVGGPSGKKMLPWLPLAKAEDTRCYSNLDSTTMHVGTFNYWFLARSFDDEYIVDSTPDTVVFFGNLSPTIDTVIVGIDDPDTPLQDFRPILGDTLYIGWNTYPGQIRGDTLATFRISVSPPNVSKYYRFYVTAGGHDHTMDPPGSGIKNWIFTIDSEDDYPYGREGEWQFDHPLNEFEQEFVVKLTVPISSPSDSIVKDPPKFFGDQVLELIGADLGEQEIFIEAIRGTTPVFDPVDTCTVIAPGEMFSTMYRVMNYARFDTYRKDFYIKLVY